MKEVLNLNSVGIDKQGIIKIVNTHLNKNADLLIGIDDPELNQLITVLVEGFASAIEQNNIGIHDDIQNMFRLT